MADGQIGSCAIYHGLVLATRNIPDFEDMGLKIMNPWTAESAGSDF
jgi:predicted nucleic acid-binding protein